MKITLRSGATLDVCGYCDSHEASYRCMCGWSSCTVVCCESCFAKHGASPGTMMAPIPVTTDNEETK